MDKRRALIIDQDVDIASLFGMMLNLIGYECTIANSAEEGLTLLMMSTPGLLVLDTQAGPGPSSIAIIDEIRATPHLKTMGIVLVSGYPYPEETLKSKVDFMLTKPLDMVQLKKLILSLRIEEKISQQDYFRDAVTGVYSRHFFVMRLEHAIERARRRPDFHFAVCVFAVDIYQLLGGEEVDSATFNTVLREAAKSLVHNFRPTDTIAALSYAKFATLHEELAHPEDIQVVVRRIQTVLLPPFRVNNQTYRLRFRIGTSQNRDNTLSAEDLIGLAEQNMITQ